MKYLAIILALTSLAFSQTKTVGPSGEGITSGTRAAFRTALDLPAMYQPLLVSGTSIKTINGSSILGSGNIALEPALGNPDNIGMVLTSTIGGSRSWTTVTSNLTSGPVTSSGGMSAIADGAIGVAKITGLGTIAVKNYTQSPTAPASPTIGDQWLDTSTMKKYERYTSSWVEVTGTTVDTSGLMVKSANLSDVANASTARSNIGAASRREYKSANFTAAAYGRYHTIGTGIVVSNPATGALGDIFDVVVASGTATINGVSYAASRFPIEVICTVAGTPGTWVTPAAKVSDTLNVGINSWDGSTITGAQAFSSATRPTSAAATGTLAAADAQSLITKGDGDARYQTFVTKTSTSDVAVTNSTALSDIPGLTGFTLAANTFYRLEFLGFVTSGASGGHVIEMSSNVNLATGSDGAQGGMGLYTKVGANGVGFVFQYSLQRYAIAGSTAAASNNAISCILLIKTGNSAPTIKFQFSQNVANATESRLFSGSMACFTKIGTY